KANRSCCCGAHVTEGSLLINREKMKNLARVLVIISLVCYLSILRYPSVVGIAGLVITIFGIVAVFQQLKDAITVYMIIVILHFLGALIKSVVQCMEIRQHEGAGDQEFIFFYSVLAILGMPFLITYWNLIQYLEDRDCAKEVPVLDDLRANKADSASPPTPVAHSSLEALPTSDAPPPYSEE
ncbi:hypothetical protein PENTCL1PPCAC_22107, partial [Pristionchus entomophagus]